MQLDQTCIPIRHRSIWEILDLSLRVMGTYGRSLLLATGLTALPYACLNFVALRHLTDNGAADATQHYLWMMAFLVFLEAPIATIPATAVLGRVMFLQDLSFRAVLLDIRESIGRLIWTQGFIRGGIFVVPIALTLDSSFESGLLLTFLTFYVVILRAARPFLNEVVLLERTPIRTGNGKNRRVTLMRRMASLHARQTGGLILRAFVMAAAIVILAFNLMLTFWFVLSIVTGNWQFSSGFLQFVWPLCMWIAVTWASVVRFLCYIDARIRREGWEVELRVKAAAIELRGITS